MRNKIHSWTWNGKPVTGTFLAMLCGTESRSLLYDYSNRLKTDVGEEIKAAMDKTRANPKNEIRIMWDGESRGLLFICKELGVSHATMFTRLKKYGKDCCLTYFPGRIPHHMFKMKPRKRRTGTTRLNESEWEGLGAAPRTKNLAKIRANGSWEKKQ